MMWLISPGRRPLPKQGKNSTFLALWIHDSSPTELYDQNNLRLIKKELEDLTNVRKVYT
jgi:hypothetical protein